MDSNEARNFRDFITDTSIKLTKSLEPMRASVSIFENKLFLLINTFIGHQRKRERKNAVCYKRHRRND